MHIRTRPTRKLVSRWTAIFAAAERTCASVKQFIRRQPETGGRHENEINQQKILLTSYFGCRRWCAARFVFQDSGVRTRTTSARNSGSKFFHSHHTRRNRH